VASWLDQAAWRFRSLEFRTLRAYDDGRAIVVMELDPGDRLAEWLWLRHLWLELPPHPQILDAIDGGSGAALLVRYAGLAWRQEPVSLETRLAQQVVATWGAQLTDALRMILAEVTDGEAGHFLRPRVTIDLVNDARLAFLPVDPAELPEDIRTTWPRCDDKAMIYVIGGVIGELCAGLDQPAAAPIRTILERCCEPSAAERYRTLDDLQAAWTQLALPDLEGERRLAWEDAQEGLGWLELGRPRAALHSLEAALERNPRLHVAAEARARARELLREDLPPPAAADSSGLEWSDVVERAKELEDVRAFRDALALYARVRLDGRNDVAIYISRARAHLALGDGGHAIDFAQRALVIDPSNVTALRMVARGHLLARHFVDAVQRADEWVTLDPDDADAHYTRGRALLGAGRLGDARDAFDRACTLRPRMLEAILLRREADRSMKLTTEQVGTPKAMTVEVPAHLAKLRDALVTGRVHEALAILEQPAYDNDAIAKLVQAECLAFDHRYVEAIAIFDHAASLAPEQEVKAMIGKVRALLALDRVAEAVATLDRMSHVDEVDVVELRGLALQRLGLASEAEDELGRVIGASESRSDLRLGRR